MFSLYLNDGRKSTMKSNKSLKKDLVKWINEIESDEMLALLFSVRNSFSENDWWQQLTEQERKAIERGVSDADAGRTMSSEVFWKRVLNEGSEKSRLDR